jgi:hypothetical protein
MLVRPQRPLIRNNFAFIGRRGRFHHYLDNFPSYERVGARMGITHQRTNRCNSSCKLVHRPKMAQAPRPESNLNDAVCL